MDTIQHFFKKFDSLPEEQQDVQKFLISELAQKCGISQKESAKILQEISESLTQFETAHNELMNCEKNGSSEKRWLQKKLKETAAETHVPLEKVGEAFTTLVNQEHQASIEELAGEKLNITDEPSKTDLRQQLGTDLETINQTAFFQMCLAAQGTVTPNASSESPTLRKALKSDYFSSEERKAKEIVAAAAYVDSLKKAEEQKETYGSSWKEILSFLPRWAAIGGARCICTAKALLKIVEANGDTSQTEEAKRYDSSSITVDHEQTLKNVFEYSAVCIGWTIEQILAFSGKKVPSGSLQWPLRFIARILASILYENVFSVNRNNNKFGKNK